MTETDVVVIGSGFGGSVAALRFARAGESVIVLERGDRVRRDRFQLDLDTLWKPHRGSYGFHDLRSRGRHIVPWLGAAVGGGSHVYAGTLKRRTSWEGFPAAIRGADMARYYDRAEELLGGGPYPDYPPYSDARATALMNGVGRRLAAEHPELVESHGPVKLAISFAPEHGPGRPGEPFVNAHGAPQRYYDPAEQSIAGGDIDTKNSLDRNYLFLAERAGAELRPLCEADRIERAADGRWTVTYRRHVPARGWARFRSRWLALRPTAPLGAPEQIAARRVVVACGAIGSTELLLRNRLIHGTLRGIGATLGTRYTTNGDYMSLVVPSRIVIALWIAFAALVGCAIAGQWIAAAIAAGLYYAGLLAAGRPYDPDVGTTNSDHLGFRGPAGESQYAYVESGRYPTPGRLVAAILVSSLAGRFRPSAYRAIVAVSNVARYVVPPFGALAHSYPIPLLAMGKDRALGVFRLARDGRAVIDYDLPANRAFYRYHDMLGKLIARALRAIWLPNPTHALFDRLEVPHNQGGVPMGESAADGVVDHAGRVFGEPDLMVLDGSIVPVSIGPNPALTIAAVAERAMELVAAQIADGGSIVADASDGAPRAEVA